MTQLLCGSSHTPPGTSPPTSPHTQHLDATSRCPEAPWSPQHTQTCSHACNNTNAMRSNHCSSLTCCRCKCMSGSQERASGTNQPLQNSHMPGGATAVAAAQHGALGMRSDSAHQSQHGPSSKGTPDIITRPVPEAAREPAEAEGQPAGQLGDLPDKPGHLGTAEQCRLANGGVCWHLLQMAVRSRQSAQKSDDDSVSLPCKVECLACVALGGQYVCRCRLLGQNPPLPPLASPLPKRSSLLCSRPFFVLRHSSGLSFPVMPVDDIDDLSSKILHLDLRDTPWGSGLL